MLTISDLQDARRDVAKVADRLVSLGSWSCVDALEFLIGALLEEHERERSSTPPGGDAVLAGLSLSPRSGPPTATPSALGSIESKPERHLRSIGSNQ